MITSIKLINFRSYTQAAFDLHPAVTLVIGPNASGKTNLLESLYVLAVTKSFRAKDRDLVTHGQGHLRIEAVTDLGEVALAYKQENGVQEKRLHHGRVRRPLSQHIGRLPTVLFEPSDLNLLTGPPDSRRKYLDFILCQTDATYLTTLNQYRRILRQRNALLSNFDTSRISDEIFAWDIKLSSAAAIIVQQRQALIEVINNLAEATYEQVAAEDSQMRLEYLPGVTGDYATAFLEALNRRLTTDLAAGFTTIGPHREDFKTHFKNNDISAVASRGELRTAVIVLKLAELEFLETATGLPPLLLLDDVFSELDNHRRQALVKRLGRHQTVITSTEADAVQADMVSNFSIIETTKSHAG